VQVAALGACRAVQRWACCAVCLAAGPCRQAGQDHQLRNSRSWCRLGIVWPCVREPAWLTGRGGAAEVRGLVLAGDARSWLAGWLGWLAWHAGRQDAGLAGHEPVRAGWFVVDQLARSATFGCPVCPGWPGKTGLPLAGRCA
jgi:hypothetical protein